MNTITKKNRQKTEKSKKITKTGGINNRKRRQLCVSATKSINKHTAKFTITFN